MVMGMSTYCLLINIHSYYKTSIVVVDISHNPYVHEPPGYIYTKERYLNLKRVKISIHYDEVLRLRGV